MGRPKGRHPKYLAFNDARALVHTLGLKSANEYIQLQGKEGLLIHSEPHKTYKNEGWAGWEDYIGPSYKKQTYRASVIPFQEAKELVRAMGVSSNQEWRLLVQAGALPDGMPSRPDYTYKGRGWAGWRDFLGTKKFLPFEEARAYARKLNITTSTEWGELMYGSLRPEFLPANPHQYYKDQGWIDWRDFLGVTRLLTFEEARDYARKLNIATSSEWFERMKGEMRPAFLPSRPHLHYKYRGWMGWQDFLRPNS